MITLRKSQERGHVNHGWLDSFHSFSFADYYDPQHMGFRTLRVINEDRVAPGEGFGTHPHKDMEILTYVVQGKLAHKDSMGHEAFINPGEVQKISAGSGITHSEYNASATEEVYLLQIWIQPQVKGIKPSYQQISLMDIEARGLYLFASPQGGKDIIKFEQDAYVYRGLLAEGIRATHALKSDRGAWVQVIKGKMEVNGQALAAGDAAAIENEATLAFKAAQDAEFLLFDLK